MKVAVIGCGRWGRRVAQTLSDMGVLAAISARRLDRLESLGKKLNVAVRSVDAVLDDPTIMAVVICVPAQAHAVLTERALASGKSVLVEKPAALTRADLDRMIAAEQRTEATVMVGHVMRYDAHVEALIDRVQRGDLGALKRIEAVRTAPGRLRMDEDVLMGFGPHAMSIILPLIGGTDHAPLQTLSRSTQSLVTPGHADTAQITLRAAHGLQISIELSWMHPLRQRKTTVIGEKAMAVLDELAPPERRLAIFDYIIDRSNGAMPALKMCEPHYVQLEAGPPLARQFAHFVDCLRSGDRPRTHLADAEAGLKILWPGDGVIKEVSDGW